MCNTSVVAKICTFDNMDKHTQCVTQFLLPMGLNSRNHWRELAITYIQVSGTISFLIVVATREEIVLIIFHFFFQQQQ